MESGLNKKSERQADWRAKNPDRAKANDARKLHKVKLQVIDLYGGRCACCGITSTDSLTVDHIHGGGRAERRAESGGRSLWYMAREGHGSGKYQILCMNCNHSKHVNGGLCCHQGGCMNDDVTDTSLRNRRRKTKVINGLGGVCNCCGETELGFLTVDHVMNDGAAHRAEKSQLGTMLDVIASDFDRTRYQVLCFNCNLNKKISGGVSCLCKTGRVIPPPEPVRFSTVILRSPDGEVMKITNIKRFCREQNVSPANIYHLIGGKIDTCKGWTLAQESTGKYERKSKKYRTIELLSPTGELIRITNVRGFCTDNGLRFQNINLMVRGKRRSVSGWTLPKLAAPTDPTTP